MRTRKLVASLLLLLACAGGPAPDAAPAAEGARRLTTADYKALMNQVADAWNRNDARRAAALFADRAVYSAPPDGRVRRGRDELFRFFGGPSGRPRPMRMEWHHLVFDEETQIGAGEYTFSYDIRTHGAVMVRIVGGQIANWREYERASPLDWEEFVGPNRF
jgi:ketosteroid isomerase-like protein